VTDAVNDQRSEREQVTSQRVGRRLDALGFEQASAGHGLAGRLWNAELMARLMEVYTPDGSQQRQPRQQTPDTTPADARGDCGLCDVCGLSRTVCGCAQAETPDQQDSTGAGAYQEELALLDRMNTYVSDPCRFCGGTHWEPQDGGPPACGGCGVRIDERRVAPMAER
jgi:hypothetical protein